MRERERGARFSKEATHSLQPNFSSIFFAKSEYAGAALSCIWLAIAVFVFFVNMTAVREGVGAQSARAVVAAPHVASRQFWPDSEGSEAPFLGAARAR